MAPWQPAFHLGIGDEGTIFINNTDGDLCLRHARHHAITKPADRHDNKTHQTFSFQPSIRNDLIKGGTIVGDRRHFLGRYAAIVVLRQANHHLHIRRGETRPRSCCSRCPAPESIGLFRPIAIRKSREAIGEQSVVYVPVAALRHCRSSRTRSPSSKHPGRKSWSEVVFGQRIRL